MKELPSIELLHQLFSYEPETGHLRWKVCLSNRGPVGKIAGSLTPDGYIYVSFLGWRLGAHRVAFAMHNGYWADPEVDHKNRVRSNNSAENLREADRSTQRMNRLVPNSTGFRGVRLAGAERKKSYQAKLVLRGKFYALGHYEHAVDAARAYDEGVLRIAGPDFPTNKSLGLLQ